jgi:asparagine synthase (glutamine-hydrolysing)
MCGICGIVNSDPGQPVQKAVLAGMNEAMCHRGPDAHGFYLKGPLGLGHRRLSIIDLATGQQPMTNEDESIWLVFNGEIYNFLELRRQLLQAGHVFRTRSDGEVILHAFEEYGDRCVQYFNGMFAFAIWDHNKKRLFLARDRVGIKPLYYACLPDCFLFASELKSLLAHPKMTRNLDFQALSQYLSYEYVPSPKSIFQGVKKLPPGHTLRLSENRIELNCYWDFALDRSETEKRRNLQDYLSELRDTLKEAVSLELISDVPVGVLLSGGLDSSSIALMLKALKVPKIQSFSVGFEDASFDESEYARLVAQQLDSEHHEIILTSQAMLELVPRLGQLLDEPLGDSSFIPTFLLSQFTRQHVKVALGGDGGDELFGGYPTLQAHLGMEAYQRFLPDNLRRHLAPWVTRKLPVSFDNISFDFKVKRFLAGQNLPPYSRHQLWMGSFSPPQKSLLLNPDFYNPSGPEAEPIYRHWQACPAQDLLNKVFYCDLKLYLEGDILAKVDRASMANSLEVRVPLLNGLLLDFSAGLSRDLKVGWLTTKYLLRRAMQDLLPPEIVRRRKKGFNMPVAKWLTGPLKPLATDMLAPARIKRHGLFNSDYIQTLLHKHLSRRQDNRKLLWTLLSFELWYDAWMG